MPKTFQKYFVIMIAETQRPIYLEGYGIIRISLEAFTKVSKQQKIFIWEKEGLIVISVRIVDVACRSELLSHVQNFVRQVKWICGNF